MRTGICALTMSALLAGAAFGQTPQPFPKPAGQTTTPAPAPARQQPASPAPQGQPAPAVPPPASRASASEPGVPDATAVFYPVHPQAQFLASYDAGRGQRYYLYGSTLRYADLVNYYRTELKERGDTIFTQPLTYMFAMGRFREETMAFWPGVTIKDWTSGGSQGYPNPTPGAQPARFPTVIMIVPPPPTAPAR